MFLVNIILLLLSPFSITYLTTFNLILFINLWIYIAFLDKYPSTLYLALVMDIDIVFCFLLLKDITALLRKK